MPATAIPLFTAHANGASAEANSNSNSNGSSSSLGLSSVSIGCSPYIVDLRTAWKTSHSVSTQRKNALLTASIGVSEGYGEVGMPPKNPLAGYHADYADVSNYTDAVVATSPVFSPEAVAALLTASSSTAVLPQLTVLLIAVLRLHDERRCTRFALEKKSNTKEGEQCTAVDHGASTNANGGGCADDSAAESEYAARKAILKVERFGRAGVEGALLDVMGGLLGVPSWALAEAWVDVITPQKEALIHHVFGDDDANVNVISAAAVQTMISVLDTFTAKARVVAAEASTQQQQQQYKGYLTVGMADPAAMAKGVLEALQQTRFIKLKLDGDEGLSYRRLLAIGAAIVGSGLHSSTKKPNAGAHADGDCLIQIVIDANSSWTPSITKRFARNVVERMRKEGAAPRIAVAGSIKTDAEEEEEEVALGSLDDYTDEAKAVYQFLGKAIRMVEQPYAPDFAVNAAKYDDAHRQQWAEARGYCNAIGGGEDNNGGIKLFADESVCSAEDLPALIPYVNGINIKLEKCGGLLSAFEFVHAAQQCPTVDFTWVGIMVGSRLLCNNAGQLLVRTTQGDVDGALLLTEVSQQFSGGFEWVVAAQIAAATDGEGHAVAVSDIRPAHGTIVIDSHSKGVGCARKPEFSS